MTDAKPSAEVKAWLARLQLSDSEGAEALELGNPNVIMREYKSGKRDPAPPTLGYMRLTETVIDALVLMRSGRHEEAKRALQKAITPACNKTVRMRAPGQEAIGPRK